MTGISRLAAGAVAAVVAVFLLSTCAEEEPEKTLLRRVHGIAMGEVWPGPEEKLYSQGNEELIIRDFFQDRKNGVFLDVGCSTPIDNSTTYYLEKHLDWSGIGVDALPEYAPGYRLKRPKTRFHNFIVTDHSGTIEEFYRAVGVPGLSSTEKDREFLGHVLTKKMIKVPTITLDELLEQDGVENIDFLSMDIEGGALKALAGFDIEKYQPGLICIEAPGLEDFIEKYFAQHGYERIEKYMKYDYVNWYYRPAKVQRPEDAG